MFRNHLTAVSFAALTFLTLGANGCGTKSPPEPGRYCDKARGFSVKFPEGWEVIEGTEQEESVVEAASPWEDDEDIFREFITVDTDELPRGMSVENYSDELDINTQNDLAHYQEEDRGDVTIDNADAKWTIITYTVAEGAMQTLSYLLVKERRVCIISCTSQPHKFDMYRSEFEKAAVSFRFE